MPDNYEKFMGKARLCVTLARRLLGYSVHDQVVEDQAVELMRLPTKTLKRWISRLPKRWKPFRSEKRITRKVAKPWWERLDDD